MAPLLSTMNAFIPVGLIFQPTATANRQSETLHTSIRRLDPVHQVFVSICSSADLVKTCVGRTALDMRMSVGHTVSDRHKISVKGMH